MEQGSDLKLWKPENYGKKFYGHPLRTLVEKSRNLMTVESRRLGIASCEFSKRLNIYKGPDD